MVSTRGAVVADPVLRVGGCPVGYPQECAGDNALVSDGQVMETTGLFRWWRVVLPLALLIVFGSWAVTSPVGSSPDDDYHLASIWCAGGERSGVCEVVNDRPQALLVPQSVGFAQECFAFDASATAACTQTLTSALVPTERVNSLKGWYPSSFYRVMNVFVGDDLQRSVLVMRMFNAAVFVALLALALTVLAPSIRSAVSVTTAVVLVPLGLFIIPSTNPSSWTVTGVIFVWAFGLALAQRTSWRSRRTWLLAVATFLAAFLAIGSRVDASAFVALAVIVVLVLTGWAKARASWISSIVLLVLATIALVQFATFGTPGSGVSGGMGTTEPGPGLFLTNVVYLPVYLIGIVGGMALGWNDTVLPPLVGVFGLLAVGVLMARGLQDVSRTKGIALLVSLGAVAAVPLVFLQREGLGVGEVVQARYLLPLALVLVLTLSLRVPFRQATDGGLPLPGMLAWVIGVGVTAAASISLWANAHRYAAGNERGLFDIDLVLEWTGLVPIPLPLTVGLGVVASAVFVAAALIGVRADAATTERRDSRTTEFRLAR